jgi:hypothetical protein
MAYSAYHRMFFDGFSNSVEDLEFFTTSALIISTPPMHHTRSGFREILKGNCRPASLDVNCPAVLR